MGQQFDRQYPAHISLAILCLGAVSGSAATLILLYLLEHVYAVGMLLEVIKHGG